MSEVRIMPSTIEECPTCNGTGRLAYPEPDDCYDCAGSGRYFWIDTGDTEQMAEITASTSGEGWLPCSWMTTR